MKENFLQNIRVAGSQDSHNKLEEQTPLQLQTLTKLKITLTFWGYILRCWKILLTTLSDSLGSLTLASREHHSLPIEEKILRANHFILCDVTSLFPQVTIIFR